MSEPTTRPQPSGESVYPWQELFQRSAEATFVLNRRRQIRYVNPAWEALTGHTAGEVLGLLCLKRRRADISALLPLALTLAPTPEVLRGERLKLRRTLPANRLGPPWWDITFVPLREGDRLLAVLGFIRAVEVAENVVVGKGITEALSELREKYTSRFSFDLLSGSSPAMQRIAAQARLAAGNTAGVWIHGSSGSGKQTLARVIHSQGITRERTFLVVDCEGLQPYLIRNLLSGPSGQLEAGNPGSLYLREPGFLSLDLQQDLSVWLEQAPNPVRVLVGSRHHADEEKRLLPELRTSLSVQSLAMPSLKERPDEIAGILERLLQRIPNLVVPQPMQESLTKIVWPGNLREMRTVLSGLSGERTEPLSETDLPRVIRDRLIHQRVPGAKPRSEAMALHEILKSVEERLLRVAMQKAGGNRTQAAELLKISRTELWRRLRDLNPEAAGE